MTYIAGGLIEATDYNGFVSNNVNANLNSVWGVGTGDRGWGQTAVGTVAATNTVAATQWAALTNTLAAACTQSNTTFTARTAPVAGNLIQIFANVNTDLTNLTINRGNAVASGTEFGTFSGATAKTTGTGSGTTAWTITFTHVVTFPSADAARYFWNAGGLVRIQYGKTSTGTDHDPDWNTLAGQCGSIFISGRVAGAAQTIAGQSYTGTTRIGGTGGTQTTLATGIGWYNLTGTPTTLFQLNNASAPYTPEFIRTTATASATQLTLVTTWVDDGSSGPGVSSNISGGTDTASPATSITGTAPTTLVTYRPPSTANLTASWGVPTITASVV